eukprot:13224445-Ditylum_brightwellii.AAC.1
MVSIWITKLQHLVLLSTINAPLNLASDIDAIFETGGEEAGYSNWNKFLHQPMILLGLSLQVDDSKGCVFVMYSIV